MTSTTNWMVGFNSFITFGTLVLSSPLTASIIDWLIEVSITSILFSLLCSIYYLYLSMTRIVIEGRTLIEITVLIFYLRRLSTNTQNKVNNSLALSNVHQQSPSSPSETTINNNDPSPPQEDVPEIKVASLSLSVEILEHNNDCSSTPFSFSSSPSSIPSSSHSIIAISELSSPTESNHFDYPLSFSNTPASPVCLSPTSTSNSFIPSPSLDFNHLDISIPIDSFIDCNPSFKSLTIPPATLVPTSTVNSDQHYHQHPHNNNNNTRHIRACISSISIPPSDNEFQREGSAILDCNDEVIVNLKKKLVKHKSTSYLHELRVINPSLRNHNK